MIPLEYVGPGWGWEAEMGGGYVEVQVVLENPPLQPHYPWTVLYLSNVGTYSLS